MTRSQTVEGHNPAILKWARESLGLTAEQVGKRLKVPAEAVLSWEHGTASPTYVQLERLAYKVYKRPVAIFFFPEVPEEPATEHSFRTLPEVDIKALSAKIHLKIRQARSYQYSLQDLCSGRNPSTTLVFRELKIQASDQPAQAAGRLRAHLGITPKEQESWRTADRAFKEWRNVLEQHGVFVFKDAFEDDDVSGFCLYDPEFPIIYINNSTAKSRQIFTLFHELTHVLLGVGGLTQSADLHLRAMAPADRRIEVFCNRFTSEFLVPGLEFQLKLGSREPTDEIVAELAQSYLVSREVILRKALDLGRIDGSTYRDRVRQLHEDRHPARRKMGGNPYNTKATYLGTGYLSLAFQKYHQHQISQSQLADHLHVRVGFLPGLEQKLLAQLPA